MISWRKRFVSILLLFSMVWALVMPLTGTPHVCEHSFSVEKHNTCCSVDTVKSCQHEQDQPVRHDHQHHCTYLCTCGCHVLAFQMEFFAFNPSEKFIQLDQQIITNYHFDYLVAVWQPPRQS